MPLRLARQAGRDLDAIYNFGVDRWGVEQADRYLDAFWTAASFIEMHPLASQVRDEIDGEVRTRRYGSHLIVYEVDGAAVLIVRVVHARSDWISDLS